MAATVLGGCHKTPEPTGQAQVSILALSAADVMKVDLAVSGPALAQPMAFSLFQQGSVWGGLVGGIPAGGNATFTVRASDRSGTEIFHGSAGNVTIVAGQVVTVVIAAQQVTPPTPFSNATPVIDSLVVSSTDVVPGAVVQLHATAHDPNPADTITYSWTAAAGTLSANDTPNVGWTAPASEGSYQLVIKVTDNHGASASTSVTMRVANANVRGQAAVTVQFNQWPIVNQVTATPAWVALGQPTALVATATDGDGDTLAYAWTSSCAGTFSNTTTSPSFLLSGQPGASACTLTVTVSDGRGGSTIGEVILPVGVPTVNQAPIIVSTLQGATIVDPGSAVTLMVEAVDPEGTALTFVWSSPVGSLAGQTDTASTSHVVWTAPATAKGDWNISVTVSDGASSTSYVFSPTPSTPLPVKLLAINDFHGQISAGKTVSGHKVGSAGVLAAYLKTAMAGKENRTLIAEAGDLVGASPASSALLQDEPSVDFFNAFANSKCATLPDPSLQSTGLDRFDVLFDPGCNLVGAPGNHEFDEGVAELMRLLGGGNHAKGPFLDNPWRGARFPVVSANITKADGTLLFRPYVIKAIEGVKIAFVGATLRDTPNIVLPSGVAGLTFGDEADAINAQVALLKAQGIHAIVVVLHSGGTGQSSYNGATKPGSGSLSSDIVGLVNRLDGDVDVVLSAHSHAFTNAFVKNAGGNDTLVTQAYSAGTAYADIDLTIDRQTDDILTKSASIPTTYADSGAGLTPDGAMVALTGAAEAMVAPIANAPVTTSTGILSKTQTSAGEAPLGDLIAEAHRVAMYADFGITNPGGMRADLPQSCATTPCAITWNDCFTSQPFSNQVMAVTLTGAQLYAALEQQWTGTNSGSSSKILQISGFSYSWSASATPGSRVVPGSVKKLDGTPVDAAANYVVAMNNYLVGGGDGFAAFTGGTNRVTGPIDLDALVTYLRTFPAPVSAASDGRITRLP
jgi:5'-nucleotidase